MKELGRVLHVSRSGLLVLKAVNVLPNIGDKASDGSNVIGTVVDVFGPVPSPYVAVKPRRGPMKKYVGRVLYV